MMMYLKVGMLCKAAAASGGENVKVESGNLSRPVAREAVDVVGAAAKAGQSPPPPILPPEITLQHSVIHTTDVHFKSWNVDASPSRQWETRNLSDPQLLYLANQSEPGLLRFGGSGNDGLHYGIGRPCPPGYPNPNQHRDRCFNETHFSSFMTFAQAAGSRLVFGINIETKDPNTGLWDASEFRSMLQWALKNGLGHVFWGFELGNEQSRPENVSLVRWAGRGGYTPERAALDFEVLHKLLVELFPQLSTRPRIIGPDIAMEASFNSSWVDVPAAIVYMQQFVGNCSVLGVDLYAVTHHEYLKIQEYATHPAPAELLDMAGTIGRAMRAAIPQTTKLWAGEIGPHTGQSPGCDHTSLRWSNWASSFWYIDSMGLKAASGYDMFCRQDFVGIDYGLIDCATFNPLPDYYAGVLWGRTMGTKVLNVSSTNSSSGGVRSYAHCTTSGDGVTLVLINLGEQAWPSATLVLAEPVTLPGTVSATIWVLTGPAGTNSSLVSLNGHVLALEKNQLPLLAGENKTLLVSANRVTLPEIPPESIQFVTLHEVGRLVGCAGV
jgi:heparanase 1